MQRTLGGFETAAVLAGEAQALNVVIVLRLATGVAPERLEFALAALQRRHPLLGVRVVRAGRGYRFAAGAPVPPLRVMERSGEAAWQAVVEGELDRAVDLHLEPPLRAVYLAPTGADGRCELILTAHHAVLDGASLAPMLVELLALCDDSAEAPETQTLEPQPPEPRAFEDQTRDGQPRLPPATEKLVPRRYRGLRGQPGRLAFLLRQLVDEVSFRLSRQALARRPSEKPAKCCILPLALPATATECLVQRSRRERVTVNGAMTAALLLAVQQHLYGGQPGAMRYFAFADLRPYLEPTPAVTTIAAHVTGLRHTAQMPTKLDFWPLARRITQQIAGTGRRGDKFHAERLMPSMIRAILRSRRARTATVALSYAGVVQLASEGSTPRNPGLHAFVSNLSCGPEFTASVKLIDDQLTWDIVHLEADMDRTLAGKIGDEIMGILTREAEDTAEGGVPT